jgi:RNA polymerase sigma-70 factor, ECF subfamily
VTYRASRLPAVSEATLLRSAALGDADALEKVIRTFAPKVYAYLCGMLGDDREAEDAMQEAFVRAARAIERYDSETDPEQWIFGLARRVAADIRPTPSAPPGETPPPGGDTDEWARRSLRALPAELREVVVLRNILRWEPEHVSRALGIPSDEVSRRLSSAYTHLTDGMRGFGR